LSLFNILKGIGRRACMYYDSAMWRIILPVAKKTGSIKNYHPIITAPVHNTVKVCAQSRGCDYQAAHCTMKPAMKFLLPGYWLSFLHSLAYLSGGRIAGGNRNFSR
jgi:hypothetical protein